MTRFFIAFFFLWTLCILPAGPAAAWAQAPAVEEVAEAAAEEEHAEGWLSVAFRWVNFLILFGGLAYLLKAPASAFFAERRNEIQGGLARARAAQADAEGRMADIERRLARLDTEVEDIRTQAAQAADAEKKRILEAAQTEMGRALSRSREEVGRIGRTLERDVRAHLAARVIERAELELQRRMDAADHQRAVRKVIRGL